MSDQPCKRVYWCMCVEHLEDYVCDTHGCLWLEEGKGCPEAELEDIAALGPDRDEYGSVQP